MVAGVAVVGARLAACRRIEERLPESSLNQATLILADISGYSRFLSDVGTAHQIDLEQGETPPAYPLMTTLLDSIVGALSPPFELAKLEGDAVFAYADDDALPMRGEAVTACMRQCYADLPQAPGEDRGRADVHLRCLRLGCQPRP